MAFLDLRWFKQVEILAPIVQMLDRIFLTLHNQVLRVEATYV